STDVPACEPNVISMQQLFSGPNVYRNLHPAVLVEHSLRRGEGTRLAANGALVGWTGKRTGRSPKDKFTVKDAVTADKVFWGEVNQPFDPQKFEALYSRVLEYLKTRDLYVQDLFAGADPQYRLPIRVIYEFAWHNLFVRDLFIRPTDEELQTHAPEFTVIAAPTFFGRSAARWNQIRGIHTRQLQPAAGAHRRHSLCRGDEEIHFWGDEFSAA